MKKEIEALVASKSGMIKVNQICTLKRWTSNPVESDIDMLEVTFSITHYSSHSYMIESRNWQGIVEEIQERQAEAFAEAAEDLNRLLKGGKLYSNEIYDL